MLLYPNAESAVERVKILDQLGFRSISSNLRFEVEPTTSYGHLNDPAPNSGELVIKKNCTDCAPVKASGWAVLPDRTSPAQIVLLSYGEGIGTVFATAHVNVASPNIANALRSNRYSRAGWETVLDPQLFPLGETVIKAWVYEPSNARFVRLSGMPKISVKEESGRA